MKEGFTCFLVLYSSRIKETRDFFASIGATIKEQEDDKVVVVWGGVELHFVTPESERLSEYSYASTQQNPGSRILLYAESENLEKTYGVVESAGGTLKSPIKDNHWGMREFLFEDPNGFKYVAYGD